MINSEKIQIVLVLYKCKLEDSSCYSTLKRHINNLSGIDYNILIYNNSPETKIEFTNEVEVVNAQGNDMLVGAYNYALRRAAEKGLRWLLLLDQDTKLSADFFNEAKLFIEKDPNNEDFVAAVPFIHQNNLHLSPQKYNPLFGPYWFVKPVFNINPNKPECLAAFNSASILNVEFMQSIGGFSKKYPLDYLDHWYFHQIYKENKRVYILNAVVEQNLSLIDYENGMTIERYKIFTRAEDNFAKSLGLFAFLMFKLRLLFRLFKQFFIKEKIKYAGITFCSLLGKKKIH